MGPGIFKNSQRKSLEAKWRQLYRVAYAWCHNADLAMDLVQETLAKALQRMHQLRDPGSESAWLFAILTNCWRDYLRQKKPEEEYIDDMHTSGGLAPDEKYTQDQLLKLLNRHLQRLDAGQREVLILVAVQGCSYEEVATILDVPIGTVMSRLARARKVFREAFARFNTPELNTPAMIRRLK